MTQRRRSHGPQDSAGSAPEGRAWTHEGLTPAQIAAGQWRVRWTDEDGVAHDVLAIPVEDWPSPPAQRPRTPGEDDLVIQDDGHAGTG